MAALRTAAVGVLVATHCVAAAAARGHPSLPGAAGPAPSHMHMGHDVLTSAYGQAAAGDADALAFGHGETSAGAGRSLLHGCHGKNRKCIRRLPQCPRCRFPRRDRNTGHCKKKFAKKVFNCPRPGTAGAGGGIDYGGFDYDYLPEDDPLDPDGVADDYSEPLEEFEVPDRFIYESNYDYAGEDLDHPEFAEVATPEDFQEALEAGAQHILITAHLNMLQSPYAPDLDGVEALNKAVGRVQNTTLSIVGQCDGPAPAAFGLTESRPAGACAVLVEEDFLDIPLGTGPQGSGLLLQRLYVAVASPAGSGSSVLLLHVDGQVWISDSVFQGGGRNCRAIDVNTADGGNPKLYAQGVEFVGFTRNLAPGIRVMRGATAMLNGVTFRDMELLEKSRGTVIEASAIAAYQASTLALSDVSFDGNVVAGAPAGDQTVAVARVAPRPTVYSIPPINVWQWPGGPTTMTEPELGSEEFFSSDVARVNAAMRAAEQAHVAVVNSYLGER